MTASELFQQLITYKELFNNLDPELNKDSFASTVKIEYAFITYEIFSKNQELLQVKITLQSQNESIKITDIYTADKSLTSKVETLINAAVRSNGFHGEGESYSDEKILEPYLLIADRIASHALNYTSGDDYYPGYYSKAELREDCLILSQINHMNSRSLDHKKNYSLRDLEFIIPISTLKEEPHYDFKIGEMFIRFADRSSANNRPCGDLILEQIEKEIKLFQSLQSSTNPD